MTVRLWMKHCKDAATTFTEGKSALLRCCRCCRCPPRLFARRLSTEHVRRCTAFYAPRSGSLRRLKFLCALRVFWRWRRLFLLRCRSSPSARHGIHAEHACSSPSLIFIAFAPEPRAHSARRERRAPRSAAAMMLLAFTRTRARCRPMPLRDMLSLRTMRCAINRYAVRADAPDARARRAASCQADAPKHICFLPDAMHHITLLVYVHAY